MGLWWIRAWNQALNDREKLWQRSQTGFSIIQCFLCLVSRWSAPWPIRVSPEHHSGVCDTEVLHTVVDDWVRDQMSRTGHFQVSRDKMRCIEQCQGSWLMLLWWVSSSEGHSSKVSWKSFVFTGEEVPDQPDSEMVDSKPEGRAKTNLPQIWRVFGNLPQCPCSYPQLTKW